MLTLQHNFKSFQCDIYKYLGIMFVVSWTCNIFGCNQEYAIEYKSK